VTDQVSHPYKTTGKIIVFSVQHRVKFDSAFRCTRLSVGLKSTPHFTVFYHTQTDT
jgi:hypothetical protein